MKLRGVWADRGNAQTAVYKTYKEMLMDAQILIQNGNGWFEFSKSRTGQLDYEGRWEKNELPDVKNYQKIAGSTFFTPSWYVFIQDAVNFNPILYVAPEVDV